MNKKRVYTRFGLGIVFFLVLYTGVFPYVMSNGIGIVFSINTIGSTTHSLEDSLNLETYVIKGASYYLESNTVFQDLLNKIENKDTLGMDYEGWIISTEKTKELIDNAITTYSILIDKAESTSYNYSVLDALARFDYDTFLVKNKLNPVIFSKIKESLSQGDIIGILKTNYANFNEISNMLSSLRNELVNQNLTDLTIILNINEKYSETTLFGSYVARIFNEIN